MLQSVLNSVHERHKNLVDGRVADYIPALAKANPSHFGIALATTDGQVFTVGETDVPFTIQSISKPLAFGMALETFGPKKVYKHVGTEPTGEFFNAISIDQRMNRPFNPMVNAGAISMSSLLYDAGDGDPFGNLLATFGRLAGRELDFDQEVFESEKASGHRNRAIANFMRHTDIIDDPVEERLDLYFRQCAIRVTARDLAIMAATLANIGQNPVNEETVISPLHVRHLLSTMFTCGMYNYAGQWAVDVGLPAKSGVGGAIMAVVNRQIGIGIFSPPLDEYGNSVRAIRACIDLAEEFGLHAFEFTNAGAGLLKAYI